MKASTLVLIATVLLTPLGGLASDLKSSEDLAKIRLEEKGFNSASTCGECHVDIYAMWLQSFHSKAMADATFLGAFQDPRVKDNERARAHCVQCHAPTLHYDTNLDPSSGLVKEGVTCDFCHSVQNMALDNQAKPFVVKQGRLKRGPLTDSQSPVHETRQAEIFENGELCGGCHEMRNLLNTPVITTYSEWREGYYGKKGTAACPDCHMPLSPGTTVTSGLVKTKRMINLHSFPGGHSRVQLHDALELSLLEETRQYGKMKVKIGLTNSGVGHAIPTGNPLRKIEVEFRAEGALGKVLHESKVELAKHFGDKSGKPVTTDLGILLDATRVLADDRVAPGETRELAFEFSAPDEKILVEATAWYVYENQQFPERSRRESLVTLTKVVNKRKLQ